MMFIDPKIVSFHEDYDYFGLRFVFLMTIQGNKIDYELFSNLTTYGFDENNNEYVHDGCELSIEIFKDEFINQMLEDFLKNKLSDSGELKGKCNFNQKSVSLWE